MSNDIDDLISDDIENIRNRQGGMDRTLPAMVELGFLSLTALAGVGWLIALFFTPDPIPSGVWLGGGMLAVGAFGFPAAVIYIMRRGGPRMISDAISGW